MKLIIFGIGSFAEHIAYVLKNDGSHDVCGFCVDSDYVPSTNKFIGLPCFSFETVEKHFDALEYNMFIAVGNNVLREQRFRSAESKGYNLISFISKSSSTYSDLVYGKNVYIESTSIHSHSKLWIIQFF